MIAKQAFGIGKLCLLSLYATPKEKEKNVRKELENEVCIYVCCLLPQKMCLCERIFNIKYIYYSSEKKAIGLHASNSFEGNIISAISGTAKGRFLYAVGSRVGKYK